MKFNKQDLISLALEDHDPTFEIIQTEVIYKRRWAEDYAQVFKYDNKYYVNRYELGSVEESGICPHEYSDDEVECVEVVPVEKTIIVYKEIK